MNRPLHILVYPAGAESSSEVFHALKNVVNIALSGASSRRDHGPFLFKRMIDGLPAVQDPRFLERLAQVIAEQGIDAIYPCHDTVAEFLAVHRARIPARVICSEEQVAHLCRHKLAVYAALAGSSHLPRLFEGTPTDADLPVHVKPDVGEGGKGAAVLRTPAEFERFFQDHDRAAYVVAELLPGEEFTVDCFSDRHGVLRFVGPRIRERVWAGVSVASQSVPPDDFRELAQELHDRLKPRGAWFFQVKRDTQGRLKLLEVSTRVASSMGLYRQLGVNLPLLSVHDAFDMDVLVMPNTFHVTMDRALTARYRHDIAYDTIYFDLDDTLLLGDRVNPTALMLAHQCREQGKHSVLITKHEHDLQTTFDRFGLSLKLFDAIVHLKREEEKADHIDRPNAIFIDNAFSERRKVHERKGIPVFDVDAITCLLDHRE